MAIQLIEQMQNQELGAQPEVIPLFFGHVVNPAMIFQWGIRFFFFFPLYDFCLYHPFLVKVGFTTTAAFLAEELLISLQDVAAMQTLRHCHVIVK